MSRLTNKVWWMVLATVAIAILVLWALTTWNISKVQAGGSPQPMYQAISDMFQAGDAVTIWTRSPIFNINTISSYPIHLHDVGKDFFLTQLGTDVICFQISAHNTNVPACVPFSSIDFFSYGK